MSSHRSQLDGGRVKDQFRILKLASHDAWLPVFTYYGVQLVHILPLAHVGRRRLVRHVPEDTLLVHDPSACWRNLDVPALHHFHHSEELHKKVFLFQKFLGENCFVCFIAQLVSVPFAFIVIPVRLNIRLGIAVGSVNNPRPLLEEL